MAKKKENNKGTVTQVISAVVDVKFEVFAASDFECVGV